MNLGEYVRILVRRGWIMLLLAVITAAGAYLLTRNETPVYRASQTVLIQPSRSDFGLTEASRLLLNPLVVAINSQQIAQEIIDELQLDMTAPALKGDVTIAPDQLRLTIQIDVNSTDSELASNVARAWGLKLQDYRNERNATVRAEDRVEAVMPDFPQISQIAPRPTLTAIAGGLLGLLVGGMIVFILEVLESSIIRRRDDLERVLGVPVLATIPHIDA
ncbi:MAG: Wzz/FepE/Etk N-terminal domain-containing protein [Aggregatilineales bacterium]